MNEFYKFGANLGESPERVLASSHSVPRWFRSKIFISHMGTDGRYILRTEPALECDTRASIQYKDAVLPV